MRKFIACLLLGMLLGMMLPLLSAQQNQNTQKPNPEIEALKKRVSELEKQLQIVENIEKMDLQAKLAEAKTKLADAEFGKFERKLRDSNDEWLRAWSTWFLVIIGTFVVIIGGAFWFWLRSTANKLIADTVEKNLDGFKEAVGQVDILKQQAKEALEEVGTLKNQHRVLEKEHAAAMLEGIIGHDLQDGYHHPEGIKVLREETLLQIFGDETYHLSLRYKAAEVLASRKSPRVVSPMLALLNSVVDADFNIDYSGPRLHDGVKFLAYIHTPEAYQGLKEFLNRLLTENPTRKDWFLEETVLSLADASVKMNIGDSVPLMKRAIPHLKNLEPADLEILRELAEYFDVFNEPEGIKEILINHLEDEIPNMESLQKNVEDKCLELLQKHDPKFVNEWGVETTAKRLLTQASKMKNEATNNSNA